jgi:3-oxoadipate enol-lactonase
MTRLRIAGRRVGYDLRGAGPVVVLCHSLGASRSIYAAQVEALSADHTVLAYDMRGHGESELGDRAPALDVLADDLAELLDVLEVGPAHLVGQSIGAMMLLRFASRAPERQATYVILDAVAFTDAGWDARYATRAARVEREGLSPALALELAERSLGATTRRQDPGFAQRYAASLMAAPSAGYAWACRALAGFDLRPQLGAIRAPVLVAAGDEDLLTTPTAARELAGAILGSTLAEIARSGHVPCLEQPAALTSLIRSWTRQHAWAAA